MNFLLFGLFLIEFCSAFGCRREKDRIKELYQQKRELQIERDELAAERDRFCHEYFDEINEVNEENRKLKEENEELKRKLEDALETSSTEIAPIKTTDAILVIPGGVASSYLLKKDGSSQIPAKISAATNDFVEDVKYAFVKGKLFIFGGESNQRKIARLDGCRFEEVSARLNDYRHASSEAISINGGSSALICFGGNSGKSCEKFDGRSAVRTFTATLAHSFGGLGIYENQPATVGGYSPKHGKAETLSSTGWRALPDFPFAIMAHSLVGLENKSMLLLGGYSSRKSQTGIWNLKNGRWRRIGELKKPGRSGSVLYSEHSIFYFAGDPSPHPIHLIDLDIKDEIEKVKMIGNQPYSDYFRPILLETSSNFCV